MPKRRITMIDDLEMPAVPHLPAVAVLDDVCDVTIIEPEAPPTETLSAVDTYMIAVPAGASHSSEVAILARLAHRTGDAAQRTLRVDWNRGTSGRPKFGSRSLRLCTGSPTSVSDLVSSIPAEKLSLESGSDRWIDDNTAIVWDGELLIGRSRATVPVTLTLRRFNSRFTLAEVAITEHRHYPRRFFSSAHGVLRYLEAGC